MFVSFSIPGDPAGKGRPRFSPRTGTARTPENTVLYENLVRTEYQIQCKSHRFGDKAMLDARIYAYYRVPKVSKKKREAMLAGKIRPTKKPDWDNIGKVVCDSLNGIAYRDDAQIVDSMVRKFYSDTPRVVVRISEIDMAY